MQTSEGLLERLLEELLERGSSAPGVVDFAVDGGEFLLRNVLISVGNEKDFNILGSRASYFFARRDRVVSGLELYACESFFLHKTHTAAVSSSSGTNIQAVRRVL